MLGVSATGFRERWPLFLGAILTVAIGVALIASAIIVASSASPPQMTGVSPMKASQVRSGFDAVATIMIISAMLTGLLTVFIVATTFAFTVSERRRDLALFRLLGAGRGQVRLMVLGEATLLGCAGAGLGALLTPLAVQLQMMLLRRAHFVPDGFVLNQPWWPVVVAAAIGVGVAILGVVAASGRAAQVPPLEAVGGKPSAARVMTMGRWIGGLTMLAVTAAQIVAASVVGLVVALALAFGVSVTAAIGLTALAPALVPGASSILGLPMRPGVLGTLAGANIRDGVQRSASTAAPVIVLLALVISITGALAAGTRAVTIQQARDIAGDLVVATTGERVDALAHMPGVAATSPEITPPIAVTVHGPGEEGNDPYLSGIVAINPSGYARLHRGRPVAGSLANLTGDHIAVMQDKIDGINPAIGDPATVRVGPRVIHAVVAAVMPNRLSTDQQILVPRSLISAEYLAHAPANVIVKTQPGVRVSSVAARAQRYGSVQSVHAWIAANAAAQQRTNDAALTVLLALSALYSVIAVVNAIVIAGSGRRREHAIARISGLTRAQVIGTTALEGALVTATGLVLGTVVVVCALTGVAVAADHSVGTAVVAVPWGLYFATLGGALMLGVLVTAAVSIVTTREHPIVAAGARE